MATIRETLDAGFTLDPDDADAQDQAIRWARSFYRVLGRNTPTDYGTALALEPEILTGLEVAANEATIAALAMVSAVEATAGARPGPVVISLVSSAAGRVRVSYVDGETLLEFHADDAVTECAVLLLRAPAAMVAVLSETAPEE